MTRISTHTDTHTHSHTPSDTGGEAAPEVIPEGRRNDTGGEASRLVRGRLIQKGGVRSGEDCRHTRTYLYVHTSYLSICPYVRIYISFYICCISTKMIDTSKSTDSPTPEPPPCIDGYIHISICFASLHTYTHTSTNTGGGGRGEVIGLTRAQ